MKKISVVMIVKNEEAMLARCLDSVKDADEIIIVDNDPDFDGTREMVENDYLSIPEIKNK